MKNLKRILVILAALTLLTLALGCERSCENEDFTQLRITNTFDQAFTLDIVFERYLDDAGTLIESKEELGEITVNGKSDTVIIVPTNMYLTGGMVPVGIGDACSIAPDEYWETKDYNPRDMYYLPCNSYDFTIDTTSYFLWMLFDELTF